MKRYSFLILGNRWAYKINKKLIQLNFQTVFIDTNNKNINLFNRISKSLNENKFDYCWIAINPKNNFKVMKFLLIKKLNVIIEKPLLFNQTQFRYLNKLRQKNKLIVIVDFQYIFLNYFKYDMKKVLSVDFIFKSKKKSKRDPLHELGSHLMAINLLYFNKAKIKSFNASFNANKNERKLILYKKNSQKNINLFDGLKEDVLRKFIKYAIDVLLNNKKNILSFYFGFRVKNELLKKVSKKYV